MKAEYHQEGETLNYTNPTEDLIEAGTLIIFGSICGIAAADIEPGRLGAIATTGVWKMPKDTAEITGGAKVYYDEANNTVTATEGDVFAGIAIENADAAASTVLVRLNG